MTNIKERSTNWCTLFTPALHHQFNTSKASRVSSLFMWLWTLWTAHPLYEYHLCVRTTRFLIYTSLSKTVLSIYIHIYIWRPVQRKFTKRSTFWCLTSCQLKLFSLWWQGLLYLLQGHSKNIRTRSGTIQSSSSLLTSPWICLEIWSTLTQSFYQEQTSHMPLHPYLIVPAVRSISKISTILYWLH
jgi:hypothetical protein